MPDHAEDGRILSFVLTSDNIISKLLDSLHKAEIPTVEKQKIARFIEQNCYWSSKTCFASCYNQTSKQVTGKVFL